MDAVVYAGRFRVPKKHKKAEHNELFSMAGKSLSGSLVGLWSRVRSRETPPRGFDLVDGQGGQAADD